MSPRTLGRTGTQTILLVEDHADTREMYREALEATGYAVIEAAKPADVLDHVCRSAISLVIMDLGLRGEGFEVAARLAMTAHPPPLIAVTGRAREGIGAEAMFAEYLVKPVMPDALLAVVRRILQA